MIKLTPAERSELRSAAHALKPTVIIGDAGLTPSVVKEVDTALNAHGLIKVRVFGDEREERIAIYESLCSELKAAPIQHIGKLLVLYRPKKDLDETGKSAPRGKGMRQVTIVKPSASGTKKPSIIKAVVKGNERVTQGGNIKRAKPRQASAKKRALSGN